MAVDSLGHLPGGKGGAPGDGLWGLGDEDRLFHRLFDLGRGVRSQAKGDGSHQAGNTKGPKEGLTPEGGRGSHGNDL